MRNIEIRKDIKRYISFLDILGRKETKNVCKHWTKMDGNPITSSKNCIEPQTHVSTELVEYVREYERKFSKTGKSKRTFDGVMLQPHVSILNCGMKN